MELFPILVSFVTLGVALTFTLWVIWTTTIVAKREGGIAAPPPSVSEHQQRRQEEEDQQQQNGDQEVSSAGLPVEPEDGNSSTNIPPSQPSPPLCLLSWKDICCSYPANTSNNKNKNNNAAPSLDASNGTSNSPASSPSSAAAVKTLHSSYGQVMASEVTAIMGSRYVWLLDIFFCSTFCLLN